MGPPLVTFYGNHGDCAFLKCVSFYNLLTGFNYMGLLTRGTVDSAIWGRRHNPEKTGWWGNPEGTGSRKQQTDLQDKGLGSAIWGWVLSVQAKDDLWIYRPVARV